MSSLISVQEIREQHKHVEYVDGEFVIKDGDEWVEGHQLLSEERDVHGGGGGGPKMVWVLPGLSL